MRTKINQLKFPPADQPSLVGKEVNIKGWVRTVRNQKTFSFIEVNDGSSLSNMQVIADQKMPHYDEIIGQLSTGVSVSVTGTLAESPGKKQALEIHVKQIDIIGLCDPETYSLQKKRHTFTFLRTISHLRPRTNTLGAISRVRNALTYATHKFFQERGFLYVNTPIITGSDCEGAGEMFRVTTLDLEELPKTEEGKVDYSQDFFGKPTYLTVSGQLNGEVYACALSDIYTFGPTFRAEKSYTKRHLAEFWMMEPEMAFADLNDANDNVEAYLKYVLKYVVEHCEEDIQFFNKFISTQLVERLTDVIETPFERASYTYAVRVLEKANKKFEYPPKWGMDLQTEHERYLTEEFFNKPVIINDFPKEIKPFYMRMNDDNKTVANLDVLVPRIGEICGGSQREERLDYLLERIRELGLKEEDYWWYIELRKYGSVPHAGYGVGFERLVQFATGMENIRDVIPFPRATGKAEF